MSANKEHSVIQVTRDDVVNAGYIYFSHNEVAHTEKLAESVYVDLDKFGVVVGVEVLNLLAEIPLDELSKKYHVHSSVSWFVDSMRNALPVTSGFDGASSMVPNHTQVTGGRLELA